MSSTDDILEELDLPEGKKEGMRQIITVLSRYHPKISIDPVRKNLLREKLLEKFPKKKSKNAPSWYGYMSVFGVFCTSLLVVFGMWNILDFLTHEHQEISNDTPLINSRGASPPQERQEAPIASPMSLSVEDKDQAQSIAREIDSIERDILESIEGSERESIATMKTEVPQEESLGEDSIEPAANAKIGETPSDMRMMATNPGMASSMAVASDTWRSLLPSYPSVMKVYQKEGKWTESEILSRSGSGLRVEERSTEKLSVIETKIENILEGKILEGALLTYAPLSKIAKSDDTLFALVPVLELRLESGEVILLSLIRGYR